MENKICNVILCNNSIEFVIIGSVEKAVIKMNELMREHLKRIGVQTTPESVRHYKEIYLWHMHETKWEVENDNNKEW